MRSAVSSVAVMDVVNLVDMAGDVPRPELDAVPVGIGNVGGSTLTRWRRRVFGHSATPRSRSFNERVVVLFPDVHREMDMSTRLTAGEADLCLPQADPGAVAGHDPGHSATFPPLDDRQAQDPVEALCGR